MATTLRAVRAARRLTTAARPLEAVDAVVCGGGVVGVACAHYLAREHGARVLLVDQRPMLSYTSALSTECYRNYWSTHAPMVSYLPSQVHTVARNFRA